MRIRLPPPLHWIKWDRKTCVMAWIDKYNYKDHHEHHQIPRDALKLILYSEFLLNQLQTFNYIIIGWIMGVWGGGRYFIYYTANATECQFQLQRIISSGFGITTKAAVFDFVWEYSNPPPIIIQLLDFFSRKELTDSALRCAVSSVVVAKLCSCAIQPPRV